MKINKYYNIRNKNIFMKQNKTKKLHVFYNLIITILVFFLAQVLMVYILNAFVLYSGGIGNYFNNAGFIPSPAINSIIILSQAVGLTLSALTSKLFFNNTKLIVSSLIIYMLILFMLIFYFIFFKRGMPATNPGLLVM